MNIEKAAIKIETANGIGATLDDLLEGAEAQVWRQDGASQGLKQAFQHVAALAEHVTKDLEEGKFDAFGDQALIAADIVKRYIQRAAGVVENLATAAEVGKLRATGKVEALKASVAAVKKVVDSENQKVAAISHALREGEVDENGDFTGLPRTRPTGLHPGNPLAARRAAEAAPQVDEPEGAPSRRKRLKKNGADA